MHTGIPPYSYGLAAHVTTIYNALACSGGQGVRPSRRTLPLEATRPGLLGTPGLVYSSPQRPGGFLRQARVIGTITSENANAAPGHWACVLMIKAIREIVG